MTLLWLCRLAGSPSSLQRPFHVVEVIAAHAQKLAVRVLRSDGRPPPRKTRLPAAGPALSDASLWGQTVSLGSVSLGSDRFTSLWGQTDSSLCVSLGSDRFRIFSAQAKGGASGSGSLGEPRGASGSLGEPRGASGSLGEPRGASGSLGEPRGASGSLGEPRGPREPRGASGSLGVRPI